MIDVATNIVLNANGEVAAVWSVKASGWTLPGGKVEPGETLASAAMRELFEETGMRARSTALLGVMANNDGRVIHVFRTSVVAAVFGKLEPGAPAAWMEPLELLRTSPYALFYRRFVEIVPSAFR